MAETVAIELVKVVFQKLADEAFKRIVRSQGIHSELAELGSTLSRIQDLLIDASQKEVTDKSVKEWLNGLQHLAYDIDDLLDDLATEAMHRELMQEPGTTTNKVRKLIPTCCTNFSLSHRLSHKLDGITSELENLEKRKKDLGLIKKDQKPKDTSRRSETSVPEPDVVGREVEKEKFLNKLLGDESSSKENFIIVPIVGMGGVGKTTLARLLYNDTKVQGHFEPKAWVCVSDDFNTLKISNTILQDLTNENKEFTDLNQLQKALTEQFKEKRFLLVVDDVWSENYGDWENLVRPFLSCAPGSRIIMTTRKDRLLKTLGFDNLDRLESLLHEDALCLLAIHALGVDNFNSHTTLKPQGEGIVKKCARLPLALKAIGRLLRTKTIREDWDDVLNSEIWDIENGNDTENSDKIVPALRLSYHDLSSDLKQLFAYCSLFPKDFLFDEEELILLWMAEGFLSPLNATKSPERLGHEYFEILLSRSFFQYAPNTDSMFMMHDLMNDLATFVSGDFFLRLDNHTKIQKENFAKHRHMSFSREEFVGYHKFEAFKRAKSLRTFLAVSIDVDPNWNFFFLSNKILVDLLPELRLLRVLCLSRFRINEIPEFIGSLKHLRYLNLSQTNIIELPENVGNLYNLQTLIVFGCNKLTKLPKSFLKLKKLRHFDLRDTPLLKKLPFGIGDLKSLYTLTKIIIRGDNGFEITNLNGFKNICGILSIEGLHEVKSPIYAREVNLSLKEITKLELKWVDVFDGSGRGRLEKEILNELKPNKDRLKELAIVSYGGMEFSNWVGDPSFHHLVHVSMCGCRKCKYLPPFGQLPSLKELFIQSMDDVKVVGLEFTSTTFVAFPSLAILRFEDMPGWEVWSTNSEVLDAVFPCLHELRLKNCPNLIEVSLEALPLVRVLEVHGCGDSVLRSLVHASSSITELRIETISGLTNKEWRGATEYLEALEELSIWRCNEIRYVLDSEIEASKFLVNLKKLEVYHCSNLVSLREKEKEDNFGSNLLSSLRYLEVKYCDNMESCFCPNSIESLRIFSCGSLTHVSFPTTTKGGQNVKSLDIRSCKELTENFNNIGMPMLEGVWIRDWINLKSFIQSGNFTHLTNLYVHNCPSIESVPDVQLSNLTPLRFMNITNCPSIDAFPCGLWPPNLIWLRIGGFKKPILEWGPQNFPTPLVDLGFYGEHVSNFRQLSDLLPSSLDRLHLDQFDKLESLSIGLQHIISLQHLNILFSPKVNHLPEPLLPLLLSMTIIGCQNLKERCNGRGSHYWPLISHIPYIRIDDSYL